MASNLLMFLTVDIDEQKQGLIALILDNYQCDWTDICCALKQMNHTNLAREIRIKYCKSKGTREQNIRALQLSIAKITVHAGGIVLKLG